MRRVNLYSIHRCTFVFTLALVYYIAKKNLIERNQRHLEASNFLAGIEFLSLTLMYC